MPSLHELARVRVDSTDPIVNILEGMETVIVTPNYLVQSPDIPVHSHYQAKQYLRQYGTQVSEPDMPAQYRVNPIELFGPASAFYVPLENTRYRVQ